MITRTFLIAAGTLLAGVTVSHAAAQEIIGDRPVLWNVHFDANRLRTGVGGEIFTSFTPLMDIFARKSKSPGAPLETVAFYGFQPQKSAHEEMPFIASFTFAAKDGGVTPLFDAVVKKHNVAVETLAGSPSIHFEHHGKEIWIAKPADTQLFLATSRALLELTLAPGATGLAGAALPERSSEIFGGSVELRPLLAGDPKLRNSELFKLLSRTEFHLDTADDGLEFSSSADLNSERDAKRAARMMEGMVAALSMNDKTTGIPWDDRLDIQRAGARIATRIHLNAQEAKLLFDNFYREVVSHSHVPTAGDSDEKGDE